MVMTPPTADWAIVRKAAFSSSTFLAEYHLLSSLAQFFQRFTAVLLRESTYRDRRG